MTRVLMDMNLSNVRDNHKHVGSIIGPCLEELRPRYMLKTKLTMNDLMTTKNKNNNTSHVFRRKPIVLRYLSPIGDQNKIGLNLDKANC